MSDERGATKPKLDDDARREGTEELRQPPLAAAVADEPRGDVDGERHEVCGGGADAIATMQLPEEDPVRNGAGDQAGNLGIATNREGELITFVEHG